MIITVDRQTKQALYLDEFTYRPLVDQTFRSGASTWNLDPPTDCNPDPPPLPVLFVGSQRQRCEPTNRTRREQLGRLWD